MEEINFSHRPVLLEECMEALAIRPDGVYVDGTAGGAGHSSEIASRLGEGGRLLALDQDATAVAVATQRLSVYGERAQVIRSNFCQVEEVCRSLGISEIDGMLMDLGVSSYQLDTAERGFSYQADAPLDMRMDVRNPLTARTVVNEYPEDALRRILFEYGEERFSSRIAANIIHAREKAPIETTGELVEIIKRSIPAAAREGGHHPAKRSFQALRIEVNAELDVIAPAIKSAVGMLRPGGRIAIITFHSLEDRIVKQTFASLASGCTCPKDFPVCVCGKRPTVKVISRKPVLPSKEELEENPRSRSAKLRIAEKL
ncbi:MAG: 16S rRNA (cytosine(1402)-N(4))-methyltransferase RsmH [Clostridia bacterium]|jgi:16S rRNA (cytosine1402-N4)-methyltransferase|nr:16S rRNA (cytosine(1402)-N(4))-methyltransferase RsmH [Clostridia bacterium]MBQ1962511.1 16S rRNA (cytosine(1402)-N(4))-methyltransferase RsmH [Clostridia bacterium]MBQ5833841.1 16S rRNA (cytosine(1402)-N(4))-methyltransferase RsmH [Clostridia bacterium]